ncbi:MAG: hypothetical protein ACT4O2_08360 [Beijerinckiaceae bacterium]
MTFKENQCCGFRISVQAQPNMTLAADECAFVTYGVSQTAFFVLTRIVLEVAYFGPGQTIPPTAAGFGALAANLVGGVVFKNC